MRYLTNDEKQEILLKSDRFTAKQLAEQYGCSRSMILKLWIGNTYYKPLSFSYYVNNNYFSSIDSKNKAYILGLIASDGNIYQRSGHQDQLRLSLKNEPSEKQLLQEILNDMNATHPITYITRKNSSYISFTIVSQQICDDLYDIGINPKKTWELDVAKIISHIPHKYHCDFLRGYFDGDGSISSTDKGKPSSVHISISCPFTVATDFLNILKNIGISASFTEDKRKYKHKFGCVVFTGYNKYLFLKYIYSQEDLCLNRKRARALEYCELIETNATNRSENINAVNKYDQFLAQRKIYETK
jgi:intein/homing endonuclease